MPRMTIAVALPGNTSATFQGERPILPEQPAPCPCLTPREQEVQQLLALRLTNKEIGQALGIGLRTTEHHVAQVLAKVGIVSRRQIAPVMLIAHPVSTGREPVPDIRTAASTVPCPHCGKAERSEPFILDLVSDPIHPLLEPTSVATRLVASVIGSR